MKKLISILLILMITIGVVSAQVPEVEELARYEVADDGELTLISGEAPDRSNNRTGADTIKATMVFMTEFSSFSTAVVTRYCWVISRET